MKGRWWQKYSEYYELVLFFCLALLTSLYWQKGMAGRLEYVTGSSMRVHCSSIQFKIRTLYPPYVGFGREELWAEADLKLDELEFALVADLEEGFAGHVLDTRVGLMHELKQLIHHRLKELPVIFEETGILANHVPV